MVMETYISAFFMSPRRAAVTAEPMVALDVMRMNVMSAMKGMLKTSVRSGQGADWPGAGTRTRRGGPRREGVGDDEDPHHRLLPRRPERRGPAAPARFHRRRVRA
jgi:hypothetical protein